MICIWYTVFAFIPYSPIFCQQNPQAFHSKSAISFPSRCLQRQLHNTTAVEIAVASFGQMTQTSEGAPLGGRKEVDGSFPRSLLRDSNATKKMIKWEICTFQDWNLTPATFMAILASGGNFADANNKTIRNVKCWTLKTMQRCKRSANSSTKKGAGVRHVDFVSDKKNKKMGTNCLRTVCFLNVLSRLLPRWSECIELAIVSLHI